MLGLAPATPAVEVRGEAGMMTIESSSVGVSEVMLRSLTLPSSLSSASSFRSDSCNVAKFELPASEVGDEKRANSRDAIGDDGRGSARTLGDMSVAMLVPVLGDRDRTRGDAGGGIADDEDILGDAAKKGERLRTGD